ncbi:hypothetical protein M9Y10_044678 [Tritrichomonas musculus]|uniref:Uncharacterized protein n=1 Tax=Tritrichomonas musculus TaxID=1915356 RepID=A0ABR2JTB6_9EUKA
MFIKKLPDQAIQNIYDKDMININSLCDKIHENNLRIKEKGKLMTRITSLYSNDTDVQKTIQKCDFDFLDKSLDQSLSLFMTNFLFGDSIKKVAIKQTESAEKSLDRCYNTISTEKEVDKSSPPSSTRSRKSRKTRRPK